MILHSVYFSAKGTTRLCADCIAEGLNLEKRDYDWLTASEPDVRRDLRRVFAAEGLLPRPSDARRASAPPNNLSVPPGTPRGRGTAGDSRDA